MKLIKILAQNRRDFQGQYKCEFCGAEIDRDKNASINLSRYKVS